MKTLFRLLLVHILLLVSCTKEYNPDGLTIIEYEKACGWCAGTAMVKIEGGKAAYSRVIPCGAEKGTINKVLTLKASEWKALLTSFNPGNFQKLEINECGVCFDGCDERIMITGKDWQHEIRFLPANVPVEIVPLLSLIKEIIRNFEEQ